MLVGLHKIQDHLRETKIKLIEVRLFDMIDLLRLTKVLLSQTKWKIRDMKRDEEKNYADKLEKENKNCLKLLKAKTA